MGSARSILRERHLPNLALLALAACGGGDGGSSSGGPAPAPVATASSAPSPSPSPSPTSSPEPGIPGPLAGGAYPGDVLGGPIVCAEGTAAFTPSGDPAPGLSSFTLTSSKIVLGGDRISAEAVDSYHVRPDLYWNDGNPGIAFKPAQKVPSQVEGFDKFVATTPQVAELTLARLAAGEARFATFGTLADNQTLCVFAMGVERALPEIAGDLDFVGNVDGFVATPSVNQRLYGSRATFKYAKATAIATVTMDLRVSQSPFKNFRAGTPTPLTRFDLTLTNVPGDRSNIKGPIVSNDGAWTGEIRADLARSYDRAATFAFYARHTDGRVIFGASALGDPACLGCWDY